MTLFTKDLLRDVLYNHTAKKAGGEIRWLFIFSRSAFAGISWSDSDLKDNGIEKVNEIEFTMRVYDYNDWLNEIVNETFTLQP